MTERYGQMAAQSSVRPSQRGTELADVRGAAIEPAHRRADAACAANDDLLYIRGVYTSGIGKDGDGAKDERWAQARDCICAAAISPGGE
jgi:hypothetical protein